MKLGIDDFIAAGGRLDELISAAKPAAALPAVETDAPPPGFTLGELAIDIPERPVDWAVKDYFPRGKLSEVIGESGIGKTAFVANLMAGVTRGRVFGDTPCNSGPVAILSAEDDGPDTLVPRLRVAGADLRLVRIFRKYFETDNGIQAVTFPEHVALLEQDLRTDGTILLVIDPISAFVGAGIETHNDSSTRRFLAVIDALAARTNCAIVFIRHVNKNSSEMNAINRGNGSGAFTNATRSSFLIALDPSDPEPEPLRKRILARIKGNLCARPPARAFRLQADESEPVHCEWLTEHSLLTANDLLRPAPAPRKAEALEHALSFLSDKLADNAKSARDIETHAQRLGISESTLKRARKRLCVQSEKRGFGQQGEWVWFIKSNEM